MSGLKRLTKFSLAAGAATAALAVFSPGAMAQARAQEASANAITIQSQDLGDALRSLARQTGSQIVFEPSTVRGRTATAVNGATTPEQALRRLLADTGLTYRSTGVGTYTILVQATDVPPTQLDAADAASSEEEIVVTAQQREERLQDVPISVSVLGSAQLDRGGVSSLADALRTVPGIASFENGQMGGRKFSVRGVTSNASALNGSSSVAYYIDEIPLVFVKFPLSPDAGAYDLSRVEVLRGPQGTLFGASALNGVVQVVTNDADLNEFEGSARATYLSTDHGDTGYRADLALGGPLVEDRLGLRVAAGHSDEGGWVDLTTLGREDANDAQRDYLRVKLNAAPTQNLRIEALAWVDENTRGSTAVSRADLTDPSAFPGLAQSRLEVYGLTATYDFDAFAVRSVTGRLSYSTEGQLDQGGVDALLTRLGSESVSQELRVYSTDAGSWDWSLGAMYRDGEDLLFQSFLNDVNFTGDAREFFTSESLALYGEVTRSFLEDHLFVTAGLRYFEDTVGNNEVEAQTRIGQPTAVPTGRREAEFSAVTPRVVVSYRPDPDTNLYASYSEGFRSGIVQPGPALRAAGGAALPVADPDRLRNYEIGARGEVFGGILGYDLAAYFIDWEDTIQVIAYQVSPVNFINVATNSEGVQGPGVDVAFTLRPTAGLTLGASVSYNDLAFIAPVISNGVTLFLKGDRPLESPELTIGADINYEWALGGGYEAGINLGANYVSEMFGGVSPTFTTGDNILFARTSFTLTTPLGWRAGLFVENLTDENGRTRAANPVTGLSERLRPRTFGIQLEADF